MGMRSVLITAAGSSSRMGGTRKKEYLDLDGKPVIERCLDAFESTGLFDLYVVTVPQGGEPEIRDVLSSWLSDEGRAKRTLFAEGSDTRQKSVRLGLQAIADREPATVLIHDGARPWVSSELIRTVQKTVDESGACVPVVPSTDALKELDGNGFLSGHLDRNRIFGAQTPQGFGFRDILLAHEKAAGDGRDYVDDTEIYQNYSGPVAAVKGDVKNRKITYPEDLHSVRGGSSGPDPRSPRVGFGYDLHRLVEGRKLLLGGVEIPSPVGEDGHSDGDVLIHAVIDALFGAARLGDIGSHFPPSDRAYKDISSRVLLRRAAALVSGKGWTISNLDCTVVLETPKILPYRDAIANTLAEDLGIPQDAISVKGKTKEKVDAVGEGRAVEAFATALIAR